MEKKMTLLYKVENNLYINLTNQCPCACTFCIRQEGDGAYGSDSLWLEHEPSLKELTDAIDKVKLEDYEEIVFCGYGEPMTRVEVLVQVCEYIKAKSQIPIRVNTNGLGNLIHNKSIESMLEGKVDCVSISLNAPNKEDYMKVTRPKFGIDSFEAMLHFAVECKKYVPKVVFTVVDCIPDAQIEASRKIANELGIAFRVREEI